MKLDHPYLHFPGDPLLQGFPQGFPQAPPPGFPQHLLQGFPKGPLPGTPSLGTLCTLQAPPISALTLGRAAAWACAQEHRPHDEQRCHRISSHEACQERQREGPTSGTGAWRVGAGTGRQLKLCVLGLCFGHRQRGSPPARGRVPGSLGLRLGNETGDRCREAGVSQDPQGCAAGTWGAPEHRLGVADSGTRRRTRIF